MRALAILTGLQFSVWHCMWPGICRSLPIFTTGVTHFLKGPFPNALILALEVAVHDVQRQGAGCCCSCCQEGSSLPEMTVLRVDLLDESVECAEEASTVRRRRQGKQDPHGARQHWIHGIWPPSSRSEILPRSRRYTSPCAGSCASQISSAV